MSVYIDPQMACLVSAQWKWPTACHMFADTVDELHAFAARIGMKRQWFQTGRDGTFPHYDLNERRRAAAVAAGAVELDRRQTRAKWDELGYRRRRVAALPSPAGIKADVGSKGATA